MSGACAVPSCSDSLRNGSEADVDCGGAACAKCKAGKRCGAAGDCSSGVCTGGVCQAPSCADGVKNGPESDVDCGGGWTVLVSLTGANNEAGIAANGSGGSGDPATFGYFNASRAVKAALGAASTESLLMRGDGPGSRRAPPRGTPGSRTPRRTCTPP